MNENMQSKARTTLSLDGKRYVYYSIKTLEQCGYPISDLPFTFKILLESLLRQYDGYTITEEHIRSLADWTRHRDSMSEIPFLPARIILQDFTGVPAVLDLASMRAAIPEDQVDKINPEVSVDLVIDHSVQVDYYGSAKALKENTRLEFERNRERYQFLNWAKNAFDNLSVVPPETGIIHQVNLEYLAKVVISKTENNETTLYPDTLFGTDSHTTMINGLGVLGWGGRWD